MLKTSGVQSRNLANGEWTKGEYIGSTRGREIESSAKIDGWLYNDRLMVAIHRNSEENRTEIMYTSGLRVRRPRYRSKKSKRKILLSFQFISFQYLM